MQRALQWVVYAGAIVLLACLTALTAASTLALVRFMLG